MPRKFASIANVPLIVRTTGETGHKHPTRPPKEKPPVAKDQGLFGVPLDARHRVVQGCSARTTLTTANGSPPTAPIT